MSTAPPLTSDQRAAALTKATAVRMARREFKQSITRGTYTLAEAIEVARSNQGLAGIRVHDLLQCLPSVGPKRASATMEAVGIAPSRRIRGLGQHQIETLVRRIRS
jgi:hypothetical protein